MSSSLDSSMISDPTNIFLAASLRYVLRSGFALEGNLTRIISYPARYWARTVRRICSLSCSFGGEIVSCAPGFVPVGIFLWGMCVHEELEWGIMAEPSP